MKKFLSIIAIIMVLAISVACFVACNKDEGKTEEPTTEAPTTEAPTTAAPDDQEPEDDANKVTVSWYQGSKLLKEEKIEKGSKVTSWTPDPVEGKEFSGWFSEASCTEAFDFETVINEDTDIFAKFTSNVYTEDTNEYYFIGTGAGDMGKAAWDHAKAEAELKMTKENVENANVYTITIKMYAGDRFQICYGGTYDGQVGIGYVQGAEYCDGVNEYDGATYTAADKKVAQVKNADGEVVFVGSDQYNKGFEVWNIILAPGMDGVYKFTFKTNPNAKDTNLLTYELVEKIEPLATTHDMHFIGTMNEWSESFEEGELALSPSEDKSFWSGIIEITEEMYADWTADEEGNLYAALKIFNTIDGAYYGIGGENILLTAGTYAFKYTVEGNVVEYEKLDYYIVGTLIDSEGKAVNYAVKEGVSPKLEAQDDGSYTVDFTAYDATGLGDYSWMVAQGKTDANGTAAIISIKVVYGSSLGIKDWYTAEGGDNWYLSAGTYTVTLAEGAVTVTPKA